MILSSTSVKGLVSRKLGGLRQKSNCWSCSTISTSEGGFPLLDSEHPPASLARILGVGIIQGPVSEGEGEQSTTRGSSLYINGSTTTKGTRTQIVNSFNCI